MAICKHIPCKNGYGAALEYLSSQHNAKGAILRNADGSPVPRDKVLINGVNCLPETFAPLCLQDQLQFQKPGDRKKVRTHQYIISFAPEDAEKGLTMAEAQRYGIDFAKKNFPGHRALVCTHPDGGRHSKNIHVHIVISSLRFADREPDAQYMRLRPDGSVKPSEYRAGCAHQDTAALRKHLLGQINEYCEQRGYAVCPEKAEEKISQKEYQLKAAGIETRNDQLRRAIADAAATTHSWDAFAEKLKNGYTHTVPVYPPIPYPDRNKLWQEYKHLNEVFWAWDNAKRTSIKQQMDDAFEDRDWCEDLDEWRAIRSRIDDLRELKRKERLYRETYQTYAKAASLALRSHNQEDAALCMERMQELTQRCNGYWKDGWERNAGSFSFVGGELKSRITWKQTTESDKKVAQLVLQAVQEEAQRRKAAESKDREVPMPIEMKIHRGEISFRHPDAKRWVRGKRLGDAYTMENLGVSPPCKEMQYQKGGNLEYVR